MNTCRLPRWFTHLLLVFVVVAGCRRPVEEVVLTDPAAMSNLPDAEPAPADWPWWRGLQQDGKARGTAPPTKWSETENVLWKVAIPGKGHASPTLWGDHLFLATADESAQTISLVCVERETGEQQWTRVVHQGGLMSQHRDNSHASATPACDGERVFIAFAVDGAVWVAAVDFQGEVVWETKAGPFGSSFGYGASPVIYKSSVIVAGDSSKSGMVAALHRQTGEMLWRTARKNVDSYGSPILVERSNGQSLLVMNGQSMVIGYNPDNGREQWRADGPASSTANSMAWEGGLVFATGGYPEAGVIALQADNGEVAWRKPINIYVSTPLAHEQRLYLVNDDGIARCLSTDDGKELWKKRLGGGVYSSPVLAGDNIYVLNRQGTTFVFKAAAKYQLVARNQVDDSTGSATPVISNGRIYLRTHRHLYCIGQPDER